jgi:cellulose synthase (UDP-forming)
MTLRGLWQDIGAGENVVTKILRVVFLLVATAVFCFLAMLPLGWPQQAVCGLLTLLMALALSRVSDSYLITLALMMMSIFCTLRYGYWRVTQAIHFFRSPSPYWHAADVFFIFGLLMAEIYAFCALFLGYFQTIWPLRRAPVPLPEDDRDWPHVDVLIPTLNEPLDLVRYTALAALNIDWPADKLHVYLLDDGCRESFKQFAFAAGIGYKTRTDNLDAKAGNINAALRSIDSPFLAFFDCDHIPTRSFLQMTLGWMLRDSKLAMLQTPHHLYSPDPFERNLGQFRTLPNEGELFYGVVQDGNDFWNATFFCGSCAVVRRKALDSVGGMAVETVTEDAHTSLRMQMRGWGTAYINVPQAAGLATESLSAHVLQRVRWARGMVQILRSDNPLFAPGLKFAQRLCYFNAMAHFLYAIPRLIFLTAPLIFLLLGRINIPGYWAAILAYALPHLVLASMTNSRIQGEHRHSFWSEIYETVLTPYILVPTLMALIYSGRGKFTVTAKGSVVERTFFDSRIAQPFLIMLLLNVAGLVVAIPRYLLWDRGRSGTITMNVLWCLFNIIILGVCTAVAREMKQVRTTVRIKLVTPIFARMPNGLRIRAETIDLSPGGSSLQIVADSSLPELSPQTQLRLAFNLQSVHTELPATIVSVEGSILRVRFENLTIAEQEVLTMVLYSRADSWIDWGAARRPDNILGSLARIFQISFQGLAQSLQTLMGARGQVAQNKSTSQSAIGPAILVLFASMLAAPAHHLNAQPSPSASSTSTLPSAAMRIPPANAGRDTPPGQYRDIFSLDDAGSSPIEMHGTSSRHDIFFRLPLTHLVRSAEIHISYAFSPGLLPKLSHLQLLMNGTLFATIAPTPVEEHGSGGDDLEADFEVPAALLEHSNTLTIRFIGHYSTNCEDPANAALWARVERNTSLDIQGVLALPSDELKNLPAPFVDPAVISPAAVPIVFASAPSLKAIQAAGVVSSYFGLNSDNHAVRFPVYIGALPEGNAIVIADSSTNQPLGLNLGAIRAPTVALRTNPHDPYGTILIIAGATADQALIASQAVALHSDLLSGPQSTLDHFRLPDARNPDDAPRWARTDKPIPLGSDTSEAELETDGSTPLVATVRLPPDLYYNSKDPEATLHIAYRYNSIPIGPRSSLQVRLNNAFVSTVPLDPGHESARESDAEVSVPVTDLHPFSNAFSFNFAFQPVIKNGCQTAVPDHLQGALLGPTTLDLRDYPHYAPLPDLELFANAGFPFTRRPDLSETTVVIPATPTRQEIETFLALMGHFSRTTGFPALRVAVAAADALHEGAQTDFVIIGAGDDQPAFNKLNNDLPVVLRGDQIQVRDTQGFFAPLHPSWGKLDSIDHIASGSLATGGTPDAIIEAIKSPYGDNRSIVAIHLKDADAFDPFLNALLKKQKSSEISGSVSVFEGAQFRSFRIGSEVYHVGVLPWWIHVDLWFMDYPYVATLIIFVLAFLLAVWIRQWFRIKARARLRMHEG